MRSDTAAKMNYRPFKIAFAALLCLFLVYLAPMAHADQQLAPSGVSAAGGNLNVSSWNCPEDIHDYYFYLGQYPDNSTSASVGWYGSGNYACDYIWSLNGGASLSAFTGNPDWPPSGDFWIQMIGQSGSVYYVQFNYSGGVLTTFSPAPANTRTHIVSIIPASGTTTASTTAIGAEVYVNSNDLSSTTAYDPQIQMTLTSPDNGTSITYFFPSASTPITTPGDQIFNATSTLQDGLYNVTTLLTVAPFGDFPGQTYDSTTTNFIVNQSAFLALQSSQYGIATTTCSVSNIAGCFQNALVYLFWPNSSAIASYTTFQALIYQKPPVGYFTLIQNALNGVTATSSTSSIPWSSGTVSFGGSVFGTLRLGIAGILWFFFLIEFWHRLRNITI